MFMCLCVFVGLIECMCFGVLLCEGMSDQIRK